MPVKCWQRNRCCWDPTEKWLAACMLFSSGAWKLILWEALFTMCKVWHIFQRKAFNYSWQVCPHGWKVTKFLTPPAEESVNQTAIATLIQAKSCSPTASRGNTEGQQRLSVTFSADCWTTGCKTSGLKQTTSLLCLGFFCSCRIGETVHPFFKNCCWT